MRPYVQAVYDVTLATARRNLSEAVYKTAWSEGQSLTAEDAVAFAGAALAELQQHDPAPPEASFGLTTREAEILKLVAAGNSNSEIASTLFISVPTVKRHVSTILGKLNLPSRPAVVAFAHTHGLA
jgi:DNA-binding NarL/FixJ family response regulator